MDKRYGKELNWLFELRGIGDYGVTSHVSSEDSEQAVKIEEEFLAIVKRLMQEGGGS
ncbi:MAG: hypothetical protein HY739_06555 [Desulfobacterales bacterium]|nr:hypothetical protein [Desulfobacterales bacterium]